MIITLLLSFIAGLLTALAPCVLPLLPVILGGSFNGEITDKKRPYIITASLVVSLVLFTILLKASTVLIGIDPKVWTIGSGVLVIVLGIFMLLPDLWAKIIGNAGIESKSQGLLNKAFKHDNKTLSAILIGAALGPVFSSCSPTYAWVIATVLPTNAALGMLYLTVYCIGLAISLLAIALLGRKYIGRIKWASNPYGWFQRSIAVLFIIVGLFIATGWDKKVQTWLVDKDFLHLVELEKKLVPSNDKSTQSIQKNAVAVPTNKASFNVKNPYQAPELVGIQNWVNSSGESLANLKGKVVLIDFWTYSCINCIRTQPYLNTWYKTYKDKGFEIIGVHAPEFAFEKVTSNVQKAVTDESIQYPVALDNDFATWQAYSNQYWPAKYLLDKDGVVRFTHFGEGKYQETEKAIQTLLAEAGTVVTDKLTSDLGQSLSNSAQTPELYLGYERGEKFANITEFKQDTAAAYILINPPANGWSLGNTWSIGAKDTISGSSDSKLKLNFSAKEVYLVMSGNNGTVRASLNGQPVTAALNGGSDVNDKGIIAVNEPRLYRLIVAPQFISDGLLELTFSKGVTINAFTFGT